MRFFLFFLILALLTSPFFACSTAHAGVTLAQITNQSRLETKSDLDPKSRGNATYWNGGVSVENNLSSAFTFTTGLFYVKRKFSNIAITNSTLSTTYENQAEYLQVPLVLKLWIFNFFYIGGGGYLAKAVSNIDRTQTTSISSGSLSTSSSLSQQVTFPQAGLRSEEAGAMGVVGISLGRRNGIFLEGRYLKTLNNLSTTGDHKVFHDLQYVVGFYNSSVLGELEKPFRSLFGRN